MESSAFCRNISLVVLAGGMGSRFGGLKQLFPLGLKRQTILEYTLDDAQAIGIRKVIFVIRKETEADFREVVLNKLFRRPFEIKLVFQELDDLPEPYKAPLGREKPWGTAHAAWVGLKNMRTPSAVLVKADDYYGPNALEAAARAATEGKNAIVGYPVEKTLSSFGPVTRSLLTVDHKNHLLEIVAQKGMTGASAPHGQLVNMTCLSLNLSILKAFESSLLYFCSSGALQTPDAECHLNDGWREAVRSGIPVDVLPTTDPWMGLTTREDIAQIEYCIGRVPVIATGCVRE
jgi:NDP-sugar pyrophosphorylase family protein